MQETQSKINGADNRPTLDWDGFKQGKFVVFCDSKKEKFLEDCKNHGIYCFLADFTIEGRNIFICSHLYKTIFSDGRYELHTLEGWEIKPNFLYGKDGLEAVKYE